MHEGKGEIMAQLRKVTINMSEDEVEALDKYIKEREYTRSGIVRKIVTHFLYERGYVISDAIPPEGDDW